MADLILIQVTPIDRLYPHVDQVQDWAASTTTRLLWDRVHDLEERLQAAEANIRQAVTAINTLQTSLASVDQLARQAYALAQSPTGSSPPGTEPSACPDPDNLTKAGINDAGANGDVGVVPTTRYESGKILGGVANEYPLLLAPTADLATRETFGEEMLERMIWHLLQAGFVAGRQRNPSSAISKDKITIQADGELWAFDVFTAFDDFTQALNMQAIRVCPADFVYSAGTPD